MTTFATRRISQETFDAVVRENVEDFDMDAAEAVREAREQFEHQGVDLTGVDVSGSEERKAERAALVADPRTPALHALRLALDWEGRFFSVEKPRARLSLGV